jgi:hypothetical protein
MNQDIPSEVAFELDDSGRPRAKWTGPAPEPSTLLQFFETDLGHDAAYCQQILDEVYLAVSGQTNGWRTTGNAFALEIFPDYVVVTAMYGRGRKPTTLSIDAFSTLVERWRGLIEP